MEAAKLPSSGVVVANYFIDDETKKLLAERRVQACTVGERTKTSDLHRLSIGVGRGEAHRGLVFADTFGDLEAFRQKMHQRRIDVVDAVATFSKNLIVIHDMNRSDSLSADRATLALMINHDDAPTPAKIVTVSDGVVYGTREDRSGAALEDHLHSLGYIVIERAVTEDGIEPVRTTLVRLAAGFSGVIVTTGGTGFGPRDLTPEGTRAAIDREAPGLAEAMRLVNPLGRLSRGICGTIGEALVVNTPGSTKGCIETFGAIADVVPHAVRLMVDNSDPHPHSEKPSDPSHSP
ncbi:MAG: molybdopterin adenylyltransferase [Verrucomicrobiales bacterium]